MMTRFYLKLALIPLCLFTAALLFIRVQPYDDAELRAFLTPPDDCPAPCFMGIQPGITTVDEAMVILEAHAWVKEVNIYQSPYDETRGLSFVWSDTRPAWLTGTGFAGFRGDIINFVMVPTALTSGDVWLSQNKPEAFSVMLSDYGAYTSIAYLYRYPNNFWITGSVKCPYFLSHWDSQVVVGVGTIAYRAYPFGLFRSEVELFQPEIIRRGREAGCRK
jgi:hypothetical protein